jgi:hypothetical protein
MSREDPMWCTKSHPACTSAKLQIFIPDEKIISSRLHYRAIKLPGCRVRTIAWYEGGALGHRGLAQAPS